MSARIYGRLAQGILRHLGDAAELVRGATRIPVTANIMRDVVLDGYYEDARVTRDIAALDASVDARIGDVLEHPQGRFYIDAVYDKNGYITRYVLQPAP